MRQISRCIPGGGGGDQSENILVGVCPGTLKIGVFGTTTTRKRGSSESGHNPKKGGLRCGHNPKKKGGGGS